MKLLILILLAVALVTSLCITWLGEQRSRSKQRSLAEQSVHLQNILAENARLSNALSCSKGLPLLSDVDHSELLKLRNEMARLRSDLRDSERLRREILRFRKALHDLEQPEQTVRDNPLALLADEMELRKKRVAQLQQWLDETPEEKIPELQFLSEESWIRSADRERITDDEFRGWMIAHRSNAEVRFSQMMHQALKQFAQANDGQFPKSVSDLKPCFQSPIDDAILERYEIVPTKTLIPALAEAGGDWAITQKHPINRERDSRLAISITGRRATFDDGRWDPLPPQD